MNRNSVYQTLCFFSLSFCSHSRRMTKVEGIPKKIEVYNCSTGQKNPLTWERFRSIGFNYWLQNPTVEMMWYPNCSFTKNKAVHKIDQAISHYLPAYALDLVARLTGKRVKWVRDLILLDSPWLYSVCVCVSSGLVGFKGALNGLEFDDF
jgi:hypothetical protein